MSPQVSKSGAFLLCFFTVLGILILMVAFAVVMIYSKKHDPGEAVKWIPIGAVLTALVSLSAGYIGLKVADSGVKGHNWNQEMFDSLNGKEEEVPPAGGDKPSVKRPQ